MQLKDQVALITGSAQGIGKAIALALAKEGANIIISDINLELAKKTAEEIKGLGIKAAAIKLNVADLSEAEKAIKEEGGIDKPRCSAFEEIISLAIPFLIAKYQH